MVSIDRLFGEFKGKEEKKFIKNGLEFITNCKKEEAEDVKVLMEKKYVEIVIVEPVYYGNGEIIEEYVGIYGLPLNGREKR